MSVRSQTRQLGNFTQFEHVNLRVPDHRLATLFFVQGLGFTRDPTRMVGVNNMWVNAGLQQFHLPIGEAHPFAGEIGLTVPDLDTLAHSLKQIAGELKGTRFAVRKTAATLQIDSPWGHRFRAHPVSYTHLTLPTIYSV